MQYKSGNKKQYQTIPEVAVRRTRQSQPYKKAAEMPGTNTRGWLKIVSSPLAGEEARKIGGEYSIGKLYSSPSSGLRPSSPSVGRRVHGFTLIELLVVVLIIGILAAVAVPQYQKAVTKSRLSGMFVLAATLTQSEQRYYLDSNEYTTDMNNLDIDLPADFTPSTKNSTTYALYSSPAVSVEIYTDRVVVQDKKSRIFILQYMADNRKRCGIMKTDANAVFGKTVCASYGGSDVSNQNYYYYSL